MAEFKLSGKNYHIITVQIELSVSTSICQSGPANDVVTIFSTMNDLGVVLLAETNFTNVTTDNIGSALLEYY